MNGAGLRLLSVAELLAAIEDVQARCPSAGDRSESISAPDEDWRSDRDGDIAAGKYEDAMERQMRWFER